MITENVGMSAPVIGLALGGTRKLQRKSAFITYPGARSTTTSCDCTPLSVAATKSRTSKSPASTSRTYVSGWYAAQRFRPAYRPSCVTSSPASKLSRSASLRGPRRERILEEVRVQGATLVVPLEVEVTGDEVDE